MLITSGKWWSVRAAQIPSDWIDLEKWESHFKANQHSEFDINRSHLSTRNINFSWDLSSGHANYLMLRIFITDTVRTVSHTNHWLLLKSNLVIYISSMSNQIFHIRFRLVWLWDHANHATSSVHIFSVLQSKCKPASNVKYYHRCPVSN